MSCDCKCSVSRPHDAMVGLQSVIVVFPDQSHFLANAVTALSIFLPTFCFDIC